MITLSIPRNAVSVSAKPKSAITGLVSRLFSGLKKMNWKPDASGMAQAQKMMDAKEAYVRQASQLAAEYALETLKNDTPVLTGKTKEGWFLKVEQSGNVTTFIIDNKDRVSVDRLNYGTKPHAIFPKKGNLLHFFIGTKEVFATSVKHPGQVGTGFVDRTRHALELQLDAIASYKG